MNFIYKAIGSMLAWFESFLGSYLMAILLFALIVKLLMLPFSIKQQKNMQKQASLRPKEMAIRKKYKGRENDRDAQNQLNLEIQEMYRENNYNMFSGCLPMLIQLPFIYVIYRAIYQPLLYITKISTDAITAIQTHIGSLSDPGELFEAFASKVSDGVYTGDQLQLVSILNNSEYCDSIIKAVPELAGKHIPNFMLGSLNLGEIPSFKSWLVLIPILVFLSQFASMKLNRRLSYQPDVQPNQGCSNWVMDISMPLMTLFMAFNFVALLGIYWIFQSILGVLQQWILKKIFPMPTFTDEDYKNAERALKGKAPKSGTRTLPSGKTYRSLHNIDADDD